MVDTEFEAWKRECEAVHNEMAAGLPLRDCLAHFAYSVQLLMFRPTHFGGVAAGYPCVSLQSTRHRHFLRRIRWDTEADAWLGVIKKFNS